MKPDRTCPNCGKPIPVGVVSGLCPACLLAQGSETGTDEAKPHHPFQAPAVSEIARLFPQLEILGLVGAGGMGAVYKARQPKLDRFVALKILPRHDTAGINFAERFNREARALARLNHPSIVAVHEFGQVEGLHFFIMEYVDGANLRQLERAGRLSPREALQVIPQICDALQYAHDEGVVHRDIKPENVLVDRKGRVKIADFGLAKILGLEGEALRLTAENQVMGTPHYMAPEQVERPLTVDHRADIYSLGVVFYEMLTGDLPLGKFPPPSRKVQVDVRLDEVVLRALENDPARRYQRASEVKSEVETITGTAASMPAAPAPEPGPAGVRYIRWAGIPVVAERNGEREVSWNGALTAIAISLMLVAGVQLIYHWVTGDSIGGYRTPYIIALLIVAAGIRWALNVDEQKLASPKTPQGTVILPSRRWRWGWSHVALASVPFAVLGWVLLRQHVIRPLLTKSAPVAVARVEPASGKLIATLPEGVSVELLAIAAPHPAPNGWWRHDGMPLTNEFMEVENLGTTKATASAGARDILVHYPNLPQGAAGPHIEFEPSFAFSGGGQIFRGGMPFYTATAYRVDFPATLRKASMRVGFDYGPWQTIATHDAGRHSGTQVRHPGDPKWESMVHQTSETAGNAQVTMVMVKDNRLWHTRVIAVDTNSVEHFYSNSTGTPVGDHMAWTYTFRKLPLSAVRDFQVQVRPIYWAEFRQFALNPVTPVPQGKPATFGPVHEVDLTELLDLDTGQTADFPDAAADATPNPFIGVAENILWMQRNGFDVAAGTGELQTLDLVCALLNDNDWETLRPAELVERWYNGQFLPRSLKPVKEGQLPVTYGFRTREGTTGMLQLLSFVGDRPGVTLRYKLMQKVSAE